MSRCSRPQCGRASVRACALRRGWTAPAAELASHYYSLLYEQVVAVVPISVFLVLVIAIFFRQSADNPGQLTGGLIAAIIGLAMFLDALRVCVMPLAELIGVELPRRVGLAGTLVVAGLLGILVTYAEPAIASLRPLAALVSPVETPYLYLALNDLQEALVFSVGLGVGIAAVLGTLRFVKQWSLKPLILMVLLPALALSCYMQWGDPRLRPLLGLAWDCGAVTTGPVTVPILLALGVGVMKSKRKQQAATSALQEAADTGAGAALEGFGIVTLASLWPVFMVQVFACITSLIYTPAEVADRPIAPPDTSIANTSPVREVIFAVRAILPLNAALILLILFVLRMPLPQVSFAVAPSTESNAVPAGSSTSDQAQPQASTTEYDAMAAASIAMGITSPGPAGSSSEEAFPTAAVTAAPAPAAAVDNASSSSTGSGASAPDPSWKAKLWAYRYLILGVLEAQVGMLLFNLGLAYGFTSLGDQVGMLLPSSFLQVEDQPDSPLYPFAAGVTITVLTVFILGVLATRAEPALNVLGRTVETLSAGNFRASMLVGAVSIGVGAGMAFGASKIMFSVGLIWLLLAKYALAIMLTGVSDESFTCIAWDSAGVTTGPVTVPFVLSLGVGFSKSVGAQEGFGILTCASVAPILAVLAINALQRLRRRAVVEMQRQTSKRRASMVPVSGLELSNANTNDTAKSSGVDIVSGRSTGASEIKVVTTADADEHPSDGQKHRSSTMETSSSNGSTTPTDTPTAGETGFALTSPSPSLAEGNPEITVQEPEPIQAPGN